MRCPRRRSLGWLCLAALLSIAPRVRADEPTLAEVEHDPAVKPPAGTGSRLFFTGLGVTAGWYGAALGTSYLWSDAPGAKRLRLPVVGPYLQLGSIGCGDREPNCTTFTVVLRTGLTIFSAVGQTGGVLAMVESFFVPTEQPTGGPQAKTSSKPVLHTYPLVTDEGLGWGLAGQF